MKIKLLILAVFLAGCGSAFDHETDEDAQQHACIEMVYSQLPPDIEASNLDPLELWHDIKIYCKSLPGDS